MVDTTVLVAGLVWPRWPYEVLQHDLRGEFQMMLSPTVIKEARRIIEKKFPIYSQDLEGLLQTSGYEKVPDPSSEEVLAHKDLMRDITDIPIALAAIKADVDYFVSEDKDFTDRSKSTAKLHARLMVLLSGTFLREVMGWTSEQLEAVRNRNWSDLER